MSLNKEKISERRTINASGWAYGIIDYGAKAFHDSKTDFLDRLVKCLLKREGMKIEGFMRKEGNDSDKTENKANDSVSQMSNLELIRYGLRLFQEIDSEGTEKLRDRLKNLKLPIFSDSEQMTALSSQA